MNDSQPFQLGEWRVLPLEDRLERPDGEGVHLEPRLMDVLVHLAGRPGVVISPRAAINRAWHGHGNVAAFAHAICDLRRRLGDDARAPRYIETIPKRGYRLIAPVRPAPDPAPAGLGAVDPVSSGTSRASEASRLRWPALLVDLRRRKVFRAVTGYLLAAWLAVQIAEVTFEPLHLPDWALTLVVVLAILGLPVVVVLSWAFELTARGLTLDIPGPAHGAGRVVRLPLAARVGLTVLIAACGVLLVSSFAPDAAPRTETPVAPAVESFVADHLAGDSAVTIGLVPFATTSADPLARQLGRSVEQEIRLHVTRVHGIRLVRLPGARSGAPAGVDFLIDGRVEAQASGFRIRVQILAMPAGELRWSDSFDVGGAQLGARALPRIAQGVAGALMDAVYQPQTVTLRAHRAD